MKRLNAIGQSDDRIISWPPELFHEFDKLTMKLSSRDQMERISARLEIRRFEERHGKELCNAMFEQIKKMDAKKKEKR